jgi:hypothetical protein
MDHHLVLDFLLAKQGGVCAIANTSCCCIYKHFRHHRTCRLHSPTVPQNSGFHTGLGPNKILVHLQDLVSTLSGAYSCHYSLGCVWALHFKLTCQVCFLLPRVHQTTNAPDGDENDLLLRSPLTPLSWSSLILWVPSLPPVSRKQLLNRLFFILIPNSS